MFVFVLFSSNLQVLYMSYLELNKKCFYIQVYRVQNWLYTQNGFFSVDTEKDFCFVINSWSPEHLIIHKGVIKTPVNF
jgi:hypothetical protein